MYKWLRSSIAAAGLLATTTINAAVIVDRQVTIRDPVCDILADQSIPTPAFDNGVPIWNYE